jgi:sulfofructose kinase
MNPEVASLGTLAVDYFGIVPVIPGKDGKTMAERLEEHPGGVAGNVITQIARLGIKAGWMGKIGGDETGDILIDNFHKDEISTDHVEVVKGKRSMFTWILVDPNGDRSITMFPNVLNEFTAEDVEKKHGDFIRSSKILMAEACVLPLSPVIRAMEIAREAGVKVVFDLDVTPTDVVRTNMGTKNDLYRTLELSDVFIPGKAAAAELLGTDDIEGHAKKLLDYGAEKVSVTLGDKGCIILNRAEMHHVPGFDVKVVDTTGAGDAFHGGFVYGMLKGFSLKETARFANACGAYCCTGIGARSVGGLADIQKLLEKKPNEDV